jgi:hypothetical protein
MPNFFLVLFFSLFCLSVAIVYCRINVVLFTSVLIVGSPQHVQAGLIAGD